jgi:hypothetical protein
VAKRVEISCDQQELIVKAMPSASLFAGVLGADFAALDPCLRQVHGGEPRRMRGSVSVERGTSLVARALGALASLPLAVTDAPIEVRIEVTDGVERWIRVFPNGRRMASTLHCNGDLLVERLGPAVLEFRLSVSGGGIRWMLEHISAFGIPLPLRWFRISATIDSRNGRYHFFVDSELRGVGRIVRYEGLLDAEA